MSRDAWGFWVFAVMVISMFILGIFNIISPGILVTFIIALFLGVKLTEWEREKNENKVLEQALKIVMKDMRKRCKKDEEKVK